MGSVNPFRIGHHFFSMAAIQLRIFGLAHAFLHFGQGLILSSVGRKRGGVEEFQVGNTQKTIAFIPAQCSVLFHYMLFSAHTERIVSQYC